MKLVRVNGKVSKKTYDKNRQLCTCVQFTTGEVYWTIITFCNYYYNNDVLYIVFTCDLISLNLMEDGARFQQDFLTEFSYHGTLHKIS